ncbi:hypothetical protein CSA17_04255 [bacterium DOLJORAL78_65_58]|nr:MAG: hypothetical protein CSA17_04255 [bacterium DOLJORAL78_65_58]
MKNSLAIVTGTSRGVGQALVENLTEKGWSVVGAARGPSPCEHPGYRHYQVDLADPQALTRWARQELAPIVKQEGVGRVGLVNNAALIGALPDGVAGAERPCRGGSADREHFFGRGPFALAGAG